MWFAQTEVCATWAALKGGAYTSSVGALVRGGRLRVVGFGAGGVPCDLRGFVGGVAVHDDDAPEDETEGVGDDGGAARRDAASGGQEDNIGEDGIDVLGGVQYQLVVFEDFVEEVGGVVEDRGDFVGTGGVAGTETAGRRLDVEAALAAGAVASLAADAAFGS